MAEGLGPNLAVEVQGLVVNFGKVQALRGIDLEVKKGEVFGVVGTNGAGKSTLIDVLSGMIRPSGGRVRVLGMDPVRQAGRLRRIIGVVPQETSLEDKLTAWENLEYFGRLLDVTGQDLQGRVEEMIRFMDLWDRRHDRLEGYSVGMKRRVHFACSLIHNPELLLVDEATAGFDPGIRREVSRLILEMSRERGITVLLTTHDLSEARSICDRLAVIHDGQIVAAGNWDDIASGTEAKLIVKGVSLLDADRIRTIISSERVSEVVGGFEIQAASASDAFETASLLEQQGIHTSAISFEVPTEEIFERLTGTSRDDTGA